MKRLVALLVGVLFVCMLAMPVFAQEGNVITVDGTAITEEYLNVNETMMVPARAVAEAMGFTVGWDEEDKAATITADAPQFLVLEYKPGEDRYIYFDKNVRYERWTRSMGVAPILKDGVTYIPAVALTLFEYAYTVENGVLNYIDTSVPDKAPYLASAVSNDKTLYEAITILSQTEDKDKTSYDVLVIATPAGTETGKYVILQVTEKNDKVTLNKVLSSDVAAFTSTEPCEWQPVEDCRIKSWYYNMLKKVKNMPEDIQTVPLAYIGGLSYGGKTFAVVSLIKNKDEKIADKYGIVYLFSSPVGDSEYRGTTEFVYFQ